MSGVLLLDQQQLSQTGYYVSVIFAIISFSNYEVNLNKTLFDLNNVYVFPLQVSDSCREEDMCTSRDCLGERPCC